jgi:hypothetical protein
MQNSYNWLRNSILQIIAFLWIAGAFGGLFIGNKAFREKFVSELADPVWWADNLGQFLLFSVATAVLVDQFAKARERHRRQAFLGWRWRVLSTPAGQKPGKDVYYDIFWEDAQRFQESEFERWRAVKSTMTTRYTMLTEDIADARAVWMVDAMEKDAHVPPHLTSLIEPKTLAIDLRNADNLPEHFKTRNDMFPVKKNT